MQITLTAQPPTTPPPADPLAWLVRLRWLAIGSQAALLGLAWVALDLPFPFVRMAALLALAAASNAWLTRMQSARNSSRIAGLALLFDAGILTALLAQSGGPANPFSVFYLVHVALAAALLDGPWALLLSVATSLGFALLFLITPEASMHVLHHGIGFALHLRGMLVAYGLAAIATGTFVARQARALRARERQILALEELRARSHRLDALHTLAAGAAHELGTPLASIALVAGELARRRDLPGSALDDALLLQKEAERCRVILQRMAADAGAPLGERPTDVPLTRFASALREQFAERIELHAEGAIVRVPEQATLQSLVCLVNNALDASPPGARVSVRLERDARGLSAVVKDQGSGIGQAELERLGEPFFTTKEPGRGMGLGLFLARALAQATGGTLSIESTLGHGTTVSLAVCEVT